MIKRIFIFLLAAVLLLTAVVLFNTFRFSAGDQDAATVQAVEIGKYDTAAIHLSQALQIKIGRAHV